MISQSRHSRRSLPPSVRHRRWPSEPATGPGHLQTIASQHMLESERKLLVVVTNQELGLRVPVTELPGKVSRLLADPVLVRVLGHPKPQDAPRPELNKEKDIETSEVPGVDREVVGGQDRRGLSSEKLAPTKSRTFRRGGYPISAEQVPDRAGGDPITELQELASNPHVAPPRVLPGQPQDQLTARLRQARPARTPPTREGSPLAAYQGAMPAQHCLRAHQQRTPGRSWQSPCERRQNQAIGRLQPRLSDRPAENTQLVAKEK